MRLAAQAMDDLDFEGRLVPTSEVRREIRWRESELTVVLSHRREY